MAEVLGVDTFEDMLLLLDVDHVVDVVAVEGLDLDFSGIPFHLEFTLGTVVGSFCGVMVPMPIGLPAPPFSAACLRCCSANCSKADCDGSFRLKKPSMPLDFFDLDDLEVFESLEVEALEEEDLDELEARLGDVVLRESNDWRIGEGSKVEVEVGVDKRWSGSGSFVDKESEVAIVCCEERDN